MELISCHESLIARLNSWVSLPKMNRHVCFITVTGICTALENKE